MAFLYFSYLALWTPYAFENWLDRASLRAQSQVAVALGISYRDVLKTPKAYAGEVVRWPLIKRGNSGWFYKGDLNKPVVWTFRSPDLHTSPRHPTVIVASVVGVDESGVRLSYKGVDRGTAFIVHLPF